MSISFKCILFSFHRNAYFIDIQAKSRGHFQYAFIYWVKNYFGFCIGNHLVQSSKLTVFLIVLRSGKHVGKELKRVFWFVLLQLYSSGWSISPNLTVIRQTSLFICSFTNINSIHCFSGCGTGRMSTVPSLNGSLDDQKNRSSAGNGFSIEVTNKVDAFLIT